VSKFMHAFDVPLALFLEGDRLPLGSLACSLLPWVVTAIFNTIWSETYGGGVERLTSHGLTREVREQPTSAVLPNGTRMEEAGAPSLVPAVSTQEEDEGG
jgi:hypothetical protein